MKVVISPAKTLDFESPLPTNEFTQGVFLKEAEVVQKSLRKLRPAELKSLMGISDKLAELNWQRNQEWELPFTAENARQAVFAFKGEVYLGLDAYTLSAQALANAQSTVRILSGLYGLLRPLDLIQPYRLEMGKALTVGKTGNLYQYWKPLIVKELNRQLHDGEVVVNLASKEYFDAVDTQLLNAKIITPEFKDYKDGQLKTISFFAKKARGLMTRYIVENNITNPEQLQLFNSEGYAFDSNLSTDAKWVFTR